MGTRNGDNKVIPLFPKAGHDREETLALGTMRDHSLAKRRGLDMADVAPARTAPGAHAEATGDTLTTPRLSALFIESLDDMIRAAPARARAGRWPDKASQTLEKAAIDIIDMLFGTVLDEPLLTRGMKDALLRAQLPVLQLAMRDTAFFADWQHPVRRLLGEIAAMLRAFIERGGEAARFEAIFREQLDRVLDDLQPNAAAFAAMHAALARAAYDLPTVADSDEAQAWTRVQAIARTYLERPLPNLARDFVTDYWVDVLQRTALAHDDEHPQWQDAVAVIEDLAWSLAPKEDQEERLRLIGQIPSLLARLNRGLDLIEVSRDERRTFFDAVVEVHAVMLRTELTPTDAPVAIESAINRVMRLQRGDWVEFSLADGSANRERLTWISPQRGILVFSNHQGQRAIQIAPEDLAELVASGEATLIFDHADADSGRTSA